MLLILSVFLRGDLPQGFDELLFCATTSDYAATFAMKPIDRRVVAGTVNLTVADRAIIATAKAS